MRKILLSMLFISACAANAAAQGKDEYHQVEFYGGFSHARVEPNSGTQTVTEGGTFTVEPCTPDGAAALGSNLQRFYCTRRGFNGLDASIAFNLSRYFGIKGDITGHFKTDTFVDHFTDSGGHTDTNRITDRAWQFLAGVQLKDNRAEGKKFKPFAHALVGAARQTSHDVQTSVGGANFTLDDRAWSFAMKLGGGLDVRLSPRVDLRVIEFDYNPVFARARAVPGNADFTLRVAGRTAHNFTFGVGLAFH